MRLKASIVYNTSSLNLDLRHENYHTLLQTQQPYDPQTYKVWTIDVDVELGVAWATPLEKYARPKRLHLL